MKRVFPWVAVFGLALVTACVTVNVYFPAAAAEQAADRFIEEVWGKDGKEKPSGQPGDPTTFDRLDPRRVIAGVVDFLIPSAHAQADVDISTPTINAIKNSMTARHAQLKSFYDSGAVGLTRDGLVAVRDPKAVPLKDRQTVNALVAEDNRDRNALYREIARANNHPEWEADIRGTFARQWVQQANPGWWYQSASGWTRK